jgi:5-methyltetrahydropteroyltriglutamate--homocysteine methyltransferase
MSWEEARIPVSHAGNLPSEDERRPVRELVQQVVERQVSCGVDIVNDGEHGKRRSGGYSGYIHERVTGWESLPLGPDRPRKREGVGARDRRDFPGVYASGLWMSGSGGPVRPGFATPGAPPESREIRVCTGPVRYVGQEAIAEDIRTLQETIAGRDVQGFVASLGPLSLGAGARNEHYASEEEYLAAVAEVVREEYRAIAAAGLVVQVDEPEFATSWMFYPDWSVAEYRRYLELCVEVINHALEGIPEELVRFHVCWGSGHRPHTNDIELRHIADLLVRINARVYSIEAGNVRHAHEWQVWRDVDLPEGRVLMPGVISHATDLVEHPELIAERLCSYANVVGRDRVQAGSDCGMGSRVGHAEIVWAKLRALGDGARLASDRLWGARSAAGAG